MSIQVNSEAQRTAQVREQHRRAVLTQIILPVAVAAVLLFVIVPLGLLIVFTDRQVNIVATFATIMVLVPIVALMVLPYVLLIGAAAGSHNLYRRLPGLLRIGRNVAHTANNGTHRVSAAVSKPVIAASERLAWLERLTGNQPPHAR